MSTTTHLITLTTITCSCGIVYGVPETWRQERRGDHKTFYCPNGCSRWFPTGTSDVEKERKRAESAEQRLRWAEARESAQRREREAAERSARAYRGHLTRLRNRISAGVCPVVGCRRNFANVKAHIASQHPEWAHEHAEVLS